MSGAAAARLRCYVAPVRGGALAGGFVPVGAADPKHDVWAFLACIKASHSELKDVDVDKLLLYGPWPSADAVPEDVAAATKGRALAPNTLLSSLVGAAGDYFFLVRVVEEAAAARAGLAGAGGGAASVAGALRGDPVRRARAAPYRIASITS